MNVLESYDYEVTAIVVSFNTRDLLRECLHSLVQECREFHDNRGAEIFVVDNASHDGSPEMVESDFASSAIPVRLIRSESNLGFGQANNVALEQAMGRFIVLLNSDAFLHPGALNLARKHIEESPLTGFGGGKLVGRDGSMQPSARCFHSIRNDALILTGLSGHFPRSRILGAPDRTWADPELTANVDWVPGAFMIMRREALAKVGIFDPRFFLYYEETDLCRRVKAAGFDVTYWPDVIVTHIGGESGRQLSSLNVSKTVSRVELWRMRSTLLYYRKHHGWQARAALALEWLLYRARYWRNRNSKDAYRQARAEEARQLGMLMQQAWKDTQGGRISPTQPW